MLKEEKLETFNGMNVVPEFVASLKDSAKWFEATGQPSCIRTGWEKRKKEGTLTSSGVPIKEFEEVSQRVKDMFKLAGLDQKTANKQTFDPEYISGLEATNNGLKAEVKKLKDDLRKKDEMMMDLLAILKEDGLIGRKKEPKDDHPSLPFPC